MKEYFNFEVCKLCGGKCCKAIPAPYTPNDIFKIFGSIEKAVVSGKVAIDWWEGSPPLYFMRPKIKRVEILYHPAWGGECINLGDTGCVLPVEQRPSYCKSLKPNLDGNCEEKFEIHNSKYWAAIAFKEAKINLSKYHEVIIPKGRIENKECKEYPLPEPEHVNCRCIIKPY